VWQTSQISPGGAWEVWTASGDDCPGVTGSPVVLLVDDCIHLFARSVDGDVLECSQSSPDGPFGGWVSIGPPV
jgi:hypothetical protein